MDLRSALILRIVIVSSVCLCCASLYVVYQTERNSTADMSRIANILARQTAVQLEMTGREMSAPMWDGFLSSVARPGLCVEYTDASRHSGGRSCFGERGDRRAPRLFESVYRQLTAGRSMVVEAVPSRRAEGAFVVVSIEPGARAEEAWTTIDGLLRFSVLIVFIFGTGAYIAIDQALQPARDIVCVLSRFSMGDRKLRLPEFRVREFKQISEGFNRLVSDLEMNLSEREALTHHLIVVQEQERQRLARDLHDEFGQYLAAIGARASGMEAVAIAEGSALVADVRRISEVTAELMKLLRDMLLRLRPPIIDEMGLTAALDGLVESWNESVRGVHHSLQISGDVDTLPDSIQIGIYRFMQECITNVAKHSDARCVIGRIAHETNMTVSKLNARSVVQMSVEDDGSATSVETGSHSGFGLRGLRERICALRGSFEIRVRPRGGWVVCATIPVASMEN